MDEIISKFYNKAKTLKDSGLDDDNIRIALIKEGLDIKGVENIICRLKPTYKVKTIKHSLLLILLGVAIFFLGGICSWIFAFGSSYIFMFFFLIAGLGILVVAAGLVKLISIII